MLHRANWAIICALVFALGLTAQDSLGVRELVVPDYPPLARTARLEGKMVLDIQVLANGHVSDVKARAALASWSRKPKGT